MSMVCGLRRASDRDIERLIARPEELQDFIESDHANAPEVEIVRPKGLLGLLLRLTPITIEQTRPRTDLPEAELLDQMQPLSREIDLDKAWHGLHFLFTGSAWEGDEPGCFLVRGGQEIGDEDYGYGPARAFRSHETRQITSFLAARSHDELTRRFDPARMTKLGIYPEVIWERDGDSLEYLLNAFDHLQAFVAQAASEGDGMLVYLV